MTLPGAARLDRALARVAEDATDKNVHLAAAELVVADAKGKSPSSRVARTGRAAARKTGGVARFGGPKVPWTGPMHFGHGGPGNPRPQGGYMVANPFLWRASDQRREQVIDLYLTRCVKAIRDNGLS